MANRRGKGGNCDRFPLLGLQNHCGRWLQPWDQKRLFLGRKVMTNLDSMLKSRRHSADKGPYSQGCGLPTGHTWLWELDCKKAEHQGIGAFELWCWRILPLAQAKNRGSHPGLLSFQLHMDSIGKPWALLGKYTQIQVLLSLLFLETSHLFSTKQSEAFFKLFFWPHHSAYGILVAQPGIKPVPL